VLIHAQQLLQTHGVRVHFARLSTANREWVV
jgi:hypothetical protein